MKSRRVAMLPSTGSVAELTRREFLQFTTLAGSGLTLAVMLPGYSNAAPVAPMSAEPLALPFVRIAPDNTVTLICKHIEMGQGSWTGLSAILAEELDAAWDQMRVESAPAQTPLYGNLFLGGGYVQVTGGSTSTAESWMQLRQAGATAKAMLVQAAAVKWNVPAAEINVSEGVLTHARSGNKASFGELASSAATVPMPTDIKLKEPAQFKLIGRDGRDKLPRIDSRAKSNGKQQYAIDLMLPGMMTAVVLRPQRFGAKVISFDATQAKAVAGVVDVVQIPQGVAVVGRDMWSAKQGRAALQVKWDESAAEKRGSDQLLQEYRQRGLTKGDVTVAQQGDIEVAFKHAAKIIEAEFEFPYLAHAPMEPLTAVCRFEAGKCEFWAGTQNPTLDQYAAAGVFGVRPDQVVIHKLAAGGAFGRRGGVTESDFTMEVLSIVKATGGKYPVRLIWTREDDLTGGYYRPLYYHRVKAGVDATGKVVAYQQHIVGQTIIGGTPVAKDMMRNGVDPLAVGGHAPEQYDLDDAACEVTWTDLKPGIPVMWWRSVSHSHMAFSKEVIIDELAEAAGKDPVAFRLARLGKHPRHTAALKLAAEKAGWTVSTAHVKNRGRGVAVQDTDGGVCAHVVEVTVDGDRIIVDRVVCAVDCGIAVTPDVIRAQMHSGICFGLSAALYGRITLTDGRVDQSNFHNYPVLRINEMPKAIEVHIVPSTNPPSGVGESAVAPIMAAVANAIRAATGIKLRRMPFDLAAARKADNKV